MVSKKLKVRLYSCTMKAPDHYIRGEALSNIFDPYRFLAPRLLGPGGLANGLKITGRGLP